MLGIPKNLSFKNLNLRKKLMFSLMLTSIITLIIVCSSFVIYELITFRGSIVRELTALSNIIGSNSTASIVFNDPESANETLSALKIEQDIEFVFIYDTNGDIFAQYIRKGLNKPDNIQIPKDNATLFKDGNLILFHPILLNSEKIGTIYLKSDLGRFYNRLKLYSVIVAFIIIASLIITYLVSSKLQATISSPILHLADTADRVSKENDYKIRAIKTSEDETGFLIDRFNEMLYQIQKRDSALHDIQKNLENRILDRTKQLQESNLELITEIDIRHRAETELKSSLHEKDILLKEVHHRVKNNLQVICSLLSLQSDDTEDENNLDRFEESKNRIMSMALVHELLYQGDNFQSLNFYDYITTLIDYLYSSFELAPEDIKFNLYVDQLSNFNINIDTAILCGLILNELISNSFKHAFPNHNSTAANTSNNHNEITIKLNKENNDLVSLIFEDNGIGFPKDIDFTNPNTLGLQLIVGLVQQMKGTIKKLEHDGTAYKINFNVK